MNEAKQTNLDLDYSITEFIATSITEDIRIMKSILVRLQALSALKNIDIDLALCRSVIGENFGNLKIQKITLDQIINYVSKKQDIKKMNNILHLYL